MEEKRKQGPDGKADRTDRDEALRDGLNMEVNVDDLAYDEEKNSYELDVKGDDPDYIHHDPYDTAVENGGDADSDFDEANPTVAGEYDKNASLETDLDELGMHIDNGNIVEVLPIDQELSRTEEDNRDDLDEEGYPRNDR